MASKRLTNRGSKLEPSVLPTKLVQGVQTATPATGRSAESTIPNPYTSYFNKSTSDARKARDTAEALRILARVNGDVSTALSSMVRLANTPVTFRAYSMDHQLSDAGTALVRSIVARFSYASDYSQGFDSRQSVDGVIESLLREVPLAGAVALELVLDENRLPYQLLPISPTTLKFATSKKKFGSGYKIIPTQRIDGEDVPLDVPTVFYSGLDADPLSAYPHAPLEAAVNNSFFASEVLEDVRRVVRRSGHSRLSVKLITEQLLRAAPPDARADPKKLSAWMEQVRQDVKSELEKLNPETALVSFDSVEAGYLSSNVGASADYGPLMNVIDALVSTSLKTPPSVLGKRMAGSQNTSSTESLLFIKMAQSLQNPVQCVLSRAMTLATRLYGHEGYVVAAFQPIDLRPKLELASYEAMFIQNVIQLLSLGFYTDQEAAELLGTGPRAPGAPPLSGTMFHQNKSIDTSQTSYDPARQSLVPKTPDKAGGKSQ